MAFAGKVWRLLVGIKDALVLIFILMFFITLFTVLTSRPNPGVVRDGALLLDLNGTLVEERSAQDPIDYLISGETPPGEYQVRDLVHAIEQAADDDRIKVIVLDLSKFMGGGQVHLQQIGAALDQFRESDKQVLTFATYYGDDAVMLASHSSEVWVDPFGGALIAGPGGSRPYFGELINNMDINAHIYKVGTYKSAVEPFSRNSMSEPARENANALLTALWDEWQANVKKARPKIDLDKATQTPAQLVKDANGDLATAALNAGLVDKLGNRVEFGDRVAEIAGKDDWDETPGSYAYTELNSWLADNPFDTSGEAIGVVTIAGEIVDGTEGPGTAGGERISDILDAALEEDLKALVVRVDSPGGSVTGSEEIRLAILRHKAKDIPIAVSMANVAASGGYWVSTPADRIFAEPETVTGSIGIFAVVPSFERLASEWGVNADGVQTTVLSGQPDFLGGFNEEVDEIFQASIENGYDDFLNRVAKSRNLTKEKVDAIGQGRVWDGGTARQNGLVDQYGGLPDALEWAAKEAGIEGDDWHPVYLGDDAPEYSNLLQLLLSEGASAPDANASANRDLFGAVAVRQKMLIHQAQADLMRLMSVQGMQAYCLECPVTPGSNGSGPPITRAEQANQSWLFQALTLFGK